MFINKRVLFYFLIFIDFGSIGFAQQLQFRGASLMNAWGGWGTDATFESTSQLASAGGNSTQLTIYTLTDGLHSPDIKDNSTDLDALKTELQQQKALGLKPFVSVRTAVQYKGAAITKDAKGCPVGGGFIPWHGVIDLDNPSEYDRWFNNHEAILMKYAKVARENGAQIFSIGNELNSLTNTKPIKEIDGDMQYWLFRVKDPEGQKEALLNIDHLQHFMDATKPSGKNKQSAEHIKAWLSTQYQLLKSDPNKKPTWIGEMDSKDRQFIIDATNAKRAYLEKKWRALIANVKTEFKAGDASRVVTYNANFDNYHNIGFLDALDSVSINAYFPLRPKDQKTGLPLAGDVTIEQFEQSWKKIDDAINEALKGTPNKCLMFTELGYVLKQGSTAYPWDYTGCQRLVTPEGKLQTQFMGFLPDAPQERADALTALNNVFRRGGFKNLCGVYLWNIYPDNPGVNDWFALLRDLPGNKAIRGLFDTKDFSGPYKGNVETSSDRPNAPPSPPPSVPLNK